MVNNANVTVRLNSKEMKKFLNSQEVQRYLLSLAEKAASEAQGKYSADGKNFNVEAWTQEGPLRTFAVVGIKDDDHARFSEAARGHILAAINKRRGSVG